MDSEGEEITIVTGIFITVAVVATISSVQFCIEEKRWMDLNVQNTKNILKALDVQKELHNKLNDPCLSIEENKVFREMLAKQEKTLSDMFTLQLKINKKLAISLYKFEYSPKL